ncbi:MAG TPA: hypothetical protein VNO20_05705 [Solirubrobacterales bacterium]|nr:hypothetical protein [Solirubrobacterales bacterium]
MREQRGRRALVILAASVAVLVGAPPASAVGPPLVLDTWVTEVTPTSARLRAEIDPNDFATTYRFEYISEAAFQANLDATPPRDGFFGAAKAPSGKEKAVVGSTVVEIVSGLAQVTTYRYRVVATNSAGTTIGQEKAFTTEPFATAFRLPDNRGWEMVSPVDKNGGAVAAPGSIFGGGAFQAAAAGGAVTYSSSSSFGGAKGAPPASQYISRRTANGWVTENVSAPLESAAYGDEPDGAPYRLFSSSLSRGLLFGGLPCRGDIEGCPAPNPVLPGTGAPPGYMAYYLRESASGVFTSLLSAADLAHTAVEPEHFEVSFAAASPNLSHVVLSSCAALTANATEVADGPGKCDPDAQNLYVRSSAGLSLVNLLPGEVTGAPGAEVAAVVGAVSADGARVYWTQGGGLYLRQGAETLAVDDSVGSGGTFETASSDGGISFFSKGGHLYRFAAATEAVTDLTPGGGVAGVLGASASGDSVYYQDASALKRWRVGATTTIAPGADAAAPANFPPATGTARVSPDGEHLAFLSAAELTLLDNAGQVQVYLYGPSAGGGAPGLVCASCKPNGERSLAPSSMPGALVNGSTRAYRPRALSAAGTRLFFETSDELVIGDTNSHLDVYQWEASGTGDCQLSPGCISLISNGRSTEDSLFIDASESGADIFFTTNESLIEPDPGSVDLYDARVNGGFPQPNRPIPCVGDSCQALPSPPDDPTPATLIETSGNPPPRFVKERRKRRSRKGRGKRKGHQKGARDKGSRNKSRGARGR